MPVLEMKQLHASDLEAQRVNSSGACELLSSRQNNRTNTHTHTHAYAVWWGEAKLTWKTASNAVCCIAVNIVVAVIFPLGSASWFSCASRRCSEYQATLFVLCQSPFKASHFKQAGVWSCMHVDAWMSKRHTQAVILHLMEGNSRTNLENIGLTLEAA